MKRLLIVGAGDFAREVVAWISSGINGSEEYRLGGFLSDDAGALDNYEMYKPGIIGAVTSYQPAPADTLIMAIATPREKLRVGEQLLSKGAKFLTYLHPTVVRAHHTEIGTGVVVCPNALISCHTRIGDFVTINVACTIGHDVTLGPGCTLSAHVDLTGFVSIEEGVFFGSHATVLPGTRIESFARIGAGSVVVHRVKSGTTVMGVPAKRISE